MESVPEFQIGDTLSIHDKTLFLYTYQIEFLTFSRHKYPAQFFISLLPDDIVIIYNLKNKVLYTYKGILASIHRYTWKYQNKIHPIRVTGYRFKLEDANTSECKGWLDKDATLYYEINAQVKDGVTCGSCRCYNDRLLTGSCFGVSVNA